MLEFLHYRDTGQYVCVYLCGHALHMYVCDYICMNMCKCVCNMCVCITYVCMYLCMFVMSAYMYCNSEGVLHSIAMVFSSSLASSGL